MPIDNITPIGTDETINAKPAVAFLLTVWGESYINQFLDISLRSLLAPGNIPALAEKYDCTFVCLTTEGDREIFEEHPVFELLTHYCDILFIDIRDLIFSGNYSATVTLAYDRGMRSVPNMCDTYFIYLVSDYVMADGSMRGLMRHMNKGVSGITAGNFQIIEENCKQYIKNLIQPNHILSISPRQLVAYALNHLHPMTTANTVNQPFCHSVHSNRLFWRVDESTLVGRFYLRHMICIKPEVENYVIGASCDYSFIPEMCPSGNVVHIDDSDDYCVVELQPLSHERNFIRHGAMNQQQLVHSLAEWTTVQHRANAHAAILFHAHEPPAETAAIIEESNRYIEEIEAALPPPIPFRAHPYWISCIEGVMDSILLRSNQGCYYRNGTFAGVIGSPVFGPVFGKKNSDYLLLHAEKKTHFVSRRRHIWNLLSSVTGHPPTVRPWHRHWLDYRTMTTQLEKLLVNQKSCLFVAATRSPFANWLQQKSTITTVYQKAELFLIRPLPVLQAALKDTQLVVLALNASQLHSLGPLMNRCLSVFTNGATLCIFVTYDHDLMFKHHMAGAVSACIGPRFEDGDMRFITSPLRPSLDYRFNRTISRFFGNERSLFRVVDSLVTLFALGGGYLVNNIVSKLGGSHQDLRATSAIVTIKLKPAVETAGEIRQRAA